MRAVPVRGVNGHGARGLAVRRRRVVVYSASVWPQGVVVLGDLYMYSRLDLASVPV